MHPTTTPMHGPFSNNNHAWYLNGPKLRPPKVKLATSRLGQILETANITARNYPSTNRNPNTWWFWPQTNQFNYSDQHSHHSHSPTIHPSPFSKRCWTKDLSQARSNMRRAARLANKVNNDPLHPSHREYRLQCKTYADLIWSTKKEHWTEWLENADKTSIWTINRLVSGPSTDGSWTRIPPLAS